METLQRRIKYKILISLKVSMSPGATTGFFPIVILHIFTGLELNCKSER